MKLENKFEQIKFTMFKEFLNKYLKEKESFFRKEILKHVNDDVVVLEGLINNIKSVNVQADTINEAENFEDLIGLECNHIY